MGWIQTFISHHLPAWIHSFTPMDDHFRCPISALFIKAAFNWSRVILERGSLTPETPGAPSVPNLYIVSPISLNRLSSFVTVASMRCREELLPLYQCYFPTGIRNQMGILLPAGNQKKTNNPIMVDQLYNTSATAPPGNLPQHKIVGKTYFTAQRVQIRRIDRPLELCPRLPDAGTRHGP